MATNPSTLPENVGRITAPDANYPYGSAKNDSTGTTGDGTPIIAPLLNDTYGFYQALLTRTGQVPSGSAETALTSQLADAVALLASTLNAPFATVAAASNINLTTGAPNTSNVVISGSGVSINSFTIAAGRVVFVRFSGTVANTLISGASITTQTGSDIPVSRGHTLVLRATAANTVEVLLNSPNAQPQASDGTVDLNTIQTPGPYPFLIGGAVGSRNANHPDGATAPAVGNGASNFYWLDVKRYTTNVFQIAYPYASGADTAVTTIKYRSLGGGVWSAWKAIPVSSSLPFTRSFTSAPQTITAGGGLTIAHGLPSAPFFVSLEFVCTVADAGYAVGDRLQRPSGGAGMGGGSSVEVWPDATNLNVRFGALSFSVANKTTGAQTALTLTSWQAVLRAFV